MTKPCATTPETTAAASSVKCELTVTSDGKWTRDGRFYCPLEVYAVVQPGDDGDLDFFDFIAGRWAGVLSPTTVTCNRSFADGVATRQQARVRVFSMISHPVAGRPYE